MEHQRLSVLDGYRALAILLVIGFHYFSRWTPPRHPETLYPYGGALSRFPLFEYGHLGVQLFFIVSGFVITLTLLGSQGWADFLIKRFARLVPTMVLCFAITFAITTALPMEQFTGAILDWLPNLAVVDPPALRRVLGWEFGTLDGVYWSLFFEVEFYSWACVLFFGFGGRRFLLVFAVFFNLVMSSYLIASVEDGGIVRFMTDYVFAREFLPWFAAGIAFHYLYRREQMPLAALLAVEALAAPLVIAIGWGDANEIPFYLAFFGLFALFVFAPGWVRLFACGPLPMIGAASYSLYLLHQNVGVTLIARIGDLLAIEHANYSVLISPSIAIILTLVSVGIYRYWEMPAKRAILKIERGPRGTYASAPSG